MNSAPKINPTAIYLMRAAAVALAAFALVMLYFGQSSHPLLWALLLLPVVLLNFIPLGKGQHPLTSKSPWLRQSGRQGREAIAYTVSVIAVIVPGYWLFAMATSSGTIGFPVLGSLFLVPIMITGLIGLRNLLKRPQSGAVPRVRLSQQAINGVILGIIGATILLLVVGNFSF